MRTAYLLLVSLLMVGCASVQDKPEPTKTAELNVASAESLLRQGHPDQALKKVLQALQENPQLPSAYKVAALIYQQSGQPDLAEKYFARAMALAPQDPSVLINYGKFLCERRDFKPAEERFLAAASHASTQRVRAIAYANAGLCVLRIPDHDRAAQYFRAALEADPDLPVAYYQLAHINFEKRRYPQARRNLQSYLKRGKHTPKTLLLALRIERALGDQAQFDYYAQTLQSRFPDSQQAREALELSPAPKARQSRPLEPDTGTLSLLLEDKRPLEREPWLLAQDPANHTIQLLSSQNERAMDYLYEHATLNEQMAYYASRRHGAIWYTLVYGSFDTAEQAHDALAALPDELQRTKPWVRGFAGIQDAIQDFKP